MPRWPFNRRRLSATRETAQDLLIEKPQSPGASSIPIIASARRASQASKDGQKRDSQPPPKSPPAIPEKEGKGAGTEWPDGDIDAEQRVEEVAQSGPDKENRPISRTYQSREDITALPMSETLQSSPHLRPVDLAKPPIPYNFHNLAGSQTSFQREDSTKKTSRPGTLRSKRSTADYSLPQRKMSSNMRKRDDRVREEEIRAMSAAVAIPKRGGDTPLRRDSKKVRGLAGIRDSTVSLPPEGSIHSSMSGLLEQRGWEVGALSIFNPRPNIRVSELPQYVAPSAVPASSAGVLYRIDSVDAKDKRPITRGSGKTGKSGKKRERIGDKADSLDSSDLRAIMERESKRKEQKQRARQEKLEQKLRSRTSRHRKDSDIRRRDAEETRRIEEARARAEQELRSLPPLTPPTDIHPAFRDISPVLDDGVGLDLLPRPALTIDPNRHQAVIQTPQEQREPVSPIDESNPFADTHSDDEEPDVSPVEEAFPETPGEVVIETAKVVRLPSTNTPPVSPVYTRGANLVFPKSGARPENLSTAPRPPIQVDRRTTEPTADRRSRWTTIFRRNNTNPRGKDVASRQAATSFSNTSRESMRNQALPAHLFNDVVRRPSAARSISGTQVPAQSKFREILPETPISPPDSRAQSPDVATAAGASIPQAIQAQSTDVQDDTFNSGSPSTPAHRAQMMSPSMASVDSEGSWLASGSLKRRSVQSGVSRSYSKSKRNPDFNASYEDLNAGTGDKDAEYFQSMRGSRSSQRTKAAASVLAGATPDEEMEIVAEGREGVEDPSTDPLKLHDGVGRQPLLVPRDPRIRSREGLLTDHSEATPIAETPTPVSANSGELALPEQDFYHADSTSASEYFDFEDEQYELASEQETPSAEGSPSPVEDPTEDPGEEVQLQSATSVRYASRHSRQFSAGSARLLDLTASRFSDADLTETPRATRPPSSPRQV